MTWWVLTIVLYLPVGWLMHWPAKLWHRWMEIEEDYSFCFVFWLWPIFLTGVLLFGVIATLLALFLGLERLGEKIEKTSGWRKFSQWIYRVFAKISIPFRKICSMVEPHD